jgi:Ohr subfamily peroxiredoxin
MKKLYQAEVKASGGRNGRVTSNDNVLDLEVRVPKEMGGPGGKFSNPEQLFAAGYAACFDSALQLVARQQGVKLDSSEVTAKVDIGQTEDNGFELAAKIEVYIPNLEREKAQQLVEQANRVCPYSKATKNNIGVEVSLV